MRVVFFGTPQFSADVLTFLLEHQVNIVGVITKPDKPQGRSKSLVPTPVKQVAIKYQLPFFQPPIVSAPEFAPNLEKWNADLFVVVAYGEIIKQHLLDMPALGCINLHTSLLPKYRGAAPIQHAIMHGEKVTGVTIMHMDKKMDAGDIIKQVQFPIGPDELLLEVQQNMFEAGSKALLQVIKDFENGQVSEHPQDHTKATLAPKVELEHCEIVWDKPASMLHNLIRAVTPEPGAWCWIWVRGEKKRLKIFRSKVVDNHVDKPGVILQFDKNGFVISTGTGALSLLQLQLEGKKMMSSEEFVRGISQNHLSFMPL